MVADVAFLGAIGKRVYDNYRDLGWHPRDCVMQGGVMALQWRILVRACLFTPVLVAIAIFHAEQMEDRHGFGPAFWTFGPGLLLIPVTAGIVYVILVDRSLFKRRFLYRLFQVPARPFRNVALFWTMSIPFWPIVLLSCLAMSPWLNTGPFAPGDLFG
jgi:hypothetical protein